MFQQQTVFLGVLWFAVLCPAQGAETVLGDTDFYYPAPINTVEIEAGISNQINSAGTRDRYHRIAYKGSLVDSAGTPFKYTKALSLSVPKLTQAQGDAQDISLVYEGGGNLQARLFSASKIIPLELRGLNQALRGTAFLGGNLQTKTYQAAVGLETRPLHWRFLSQAAVSNWLTVGLHGQHQEATDSPFSDGGTSLFTYRAFVGKAFAWTKCADMTSVQHAVVDSILTQAPRYTDALVAQERIMQIPPGERTRIQDVFLDAVYEAGQTIRKSALGRDNNTAWREAAQAIALGDADAATDCPTLAVYAEWSGWLTLSGQHTGSRNKNLISATLDYWPLKNNDSTLLRLRYEKGFERAAPTIKKDLATLSVVLRY